jgi:DNA repair protein RecO (recombination protein O)
VVTLWTEGFGKISAIAKGARRLKSPFESALDLLSRSSVVFLTKTGDTLDLLTEAKLQRRFRSAQRGLLPLYCGFHAVELTNVLPNFVCQLMHRSGANTSIDQSGRSIVGRCKPPKRR